MVIDADRSLSLPSTRRSLGGVLPVIQTVFDSDGRIDAAGLDEELDWIAAQGADGFVTGMVSELLRLTESERHDLSEMVTSAAHRHDLISVISCGAESTVTAVAHAEHAAEHGADALMAAPPLTVALGDDGIFEYYSAIAMSTELPIVVQDASGYVGRALSIAVQVRLLDTFGDQIYFKPEASPIGLRLTQLRDATGGLARVFEGSGGAALIDSYRRGIVGTMPGSEVCWAIRRLWDAATGGDWTTAYAISGTLNALISLQTTIDSYVAVEKHLLARQGVIRSVRVRGPVGIRLDDETRAEVDRLYERLHAVASVG